MDTYPWSEAYATGNWVIDTQHRRLLELAGLLSDALAEERGDEVAEQAMAALESYVRFHFAEEEAFLAAIRAPSLAKHRRIHASLTLDVEAMRFNLVARYPGVGEQLARWVMNCLVPHMIVEDMAAIEATGGKGSRPRPEAGEERAL